MGEAVILTIQNKHVYNLLKIKRQQRLGNNTQVSPKTPSIIKWNKSTT